MNGEYKEVGGWEGSGVGGGRGWAAGGGINSVSVRTVWTSQL